MLRRLLLLLCLLCLTSCHQADDQGLSTQAPSILAPLTGQPFRLRAGETAFIQNTDLQLIFESVLQDSRCPVDVTCVWSGEAVIALLAIQPGHEPQRLALSTLPEKSKTTISDYLIELRQVVPTPQKAGVVLPADQYIVTLVVFSR